MSSKSRNLLNSIIVLIALFFVLACACPNVRDLEDGSSRNDTNNEDTKQENASDNYDEKKTKKNKSKSEKPDNGDFIVQHSSVSNEKFDVIDRQIKDEKVLEKAADKLNRTLALPHDIPLKTRDCGKKNAYYDPRDKSITFCYELMEHFYNLYRGAGDSQSQASKRMNKAINFVFLHELGHALIDSYNLPITANEEDAADRCSSYICIEELGEPGVESILAAADAFRLESKMGKQPDANSLADEHLLKEQRFFNSLCMVYGSNPEKYRDFVTKGYLPKARAVRCPTEYNRTSRSWEKLLEPWRKD